MTTLFHVRRFFSVEYLVVLVPWSVKFIKATNMINETDHVPM